jgi:N-acyl-D-aspartate/D-glutamate deacylase
MNARAFHNPEEMVTTDLLVHGGTLVDGTGAPARVADVRIRDGRIVEVGPGLEADSEAEIDAGGAIVAPGFIDIHTHFDPSLFWDPFCDPSPQHGVTTALQGNCSLSLFPLRPEHRDDAAAMFCQIEDMPATALAEGVPWDWTGYDGYRDAFAAGGLGLNVATMIGHSMLRWFVMGEAAWERVATEDEIAGMSRVLDDSIRAGAFGLSTSFTDRDHHGRPVPPLFADDAEFGALCDVLARHRAILEFVPGLADGTADDDIERMGRLCGARGVVSTWNVVSQSARDPERASRLLRLTMRQQAAGISIWPQATPRTFDLRINWSRSVIFSTMPDGWGRAIRTSEREKPALLADPEWRATARAEWDRSKLSPFPTWDISRIRLISVTRPEHERWLGSTLADLVAERGGHPSDVLADWLLDNDLDPGVVAIGVLNDDVEEVAEILTHPATLVGASDNGAHVAMFCAAGDTTLFLTRHVRDRGDLTLEAGIHEITGRLASTLGFDDRGVVAVGAAGDLVVFDFAELHWDQDEFVTDLPGGGSRLRRPPGGYRYTVVGGEVVQSAGVLTGARPGRPIGRAAT